MKASCGVNPTVKFRLSATRYHYQNSRVKSPIGYRKIMHKKLLPLLMNEPLESLNLSFKQLEKDFRKPLEMHAGE